MNEITGVIRCFARGAENNTQEAVQQALHTIKETREIKTTEREDLVSALFYLILTTPGFRKQVALINDILDSTGSDVQIALLDYAIAHFHAVKSDRKDKFFYLMDRCFSLLSFKELLAIKDLEVLEHACKFINNNKPSDWDDALFLGFLAGCQPWLCARFDNIRVGEELVRPILKRKGIAEENRRALLGLFK